MLDASFGIDQGFVDLLFSLSISLMLLKSLVDVLLKIVLFLFDCGGLSALETKSLKFF
jgi:hypothetical protein